MTIRDDLGSTDGGRGLSDCMSPNVIQPKTAIAATTINMTSGFTDKQPNEN